MLTCYDYTMARLMQQAGVPMLLVGDSASNVILGHSTTLPITLEFLIELTAAVRRGAPLALVIADMPFGSYQASVEQAVKNVSKMVKLSGCDGVKLEVDHGHAPQVRALADAGVAVIAHLGLRPQAIGMMGAYRYQGRTAEQADQLLQLARAMEQAGASAILLEATVPEIALAVSQTCNLPIIGCGGGRYCDASVVVTHDAIGWTENRPRFVPDLGDLASPLRNALAAYAAAVEARSYPAPEQEYSMDPEQRKRFLESHGLKPQ